MRTGIWSGLILGMIPLILIMPGYSRAEGPGQDQGTIPDPNNPVDIFYQADYSYIYNNNDKDDPSGQWVSSITVTDIQYRDMGANPPDQTYDYFFKKVTIPWVRITYFDTINSTQFSVIYPYCEGNWVSYKLVQSAISFSEGNSAPNDPNYDEITGEYKLDVNGDGVLDFMFDQWWSIMRFGNPGQIAGGELIMRINVQISPQNWQVDNNTIQSMEFAYYINADIGNSTDQIDTYNPNNAAWEDLSSETGPVSVPYVGGVPRPCVRFSDGNYKTVLVPSNNGESWADYYVLAYHANGEYSQYPSNYVNSESLEPNQGADPVMWCIEGYDISANNFPPAGNNWCVVQVGGLTA